MSQGNKGEVKKQEFLHQFIYELLLFLLLLLIYSHVHTLFGSFLPPALLHPPTFRQNLFCPSL
jgi:hypothetical protein